VASAAGLVWFTATLAGLTPISYSVPAAAVGAAIFMAVNLGFLLAAIGRIRSSRFAGNRRSSTRLPIRVPASLDGRPCRIEDLSVTDARVTIDAGRSPPASAASNTLSLATDGGVIDLACDVRRRIHIAAGRVELGLSFAPDQEPVIARLTVAVFHPAVLPASGDAPDSDHTLVWRAAA